MTASAGVLTSTPMRPAASLTRPGFALPPGALDGHVHVFGPEARYPRVPDPHYTLPDGGLPLLVAMLDAMGLARCAIVQPSYYGTDNRCLLDALDALGGRAVGVVMVDDAIADAALDAMHARGVRAVRLDLFKRGAWPIADIAAYIARTMARVRRLGWHVQFYTPGTVVRDLVPALPDFEVPYVIDHMGYMLESDGLGRVDFDRLVESVRRGRGWIKLSGAYRIARDRQYGRLAPYARAIVDALPERTIWGSDWPHIPDGALDTGTLLDLLAEWVPDAARRDAILAGNAARLYDGFHG
jgi:predicted TIM-barrel fold metal-dependent hydrolase